MTTIIGYCVIFIYYIACMIFGHFLFKVAFMLFCVGIFLIDIIKYTDTIIRHYSKSSDNIDNIIHLCTIISIAPLFLLGVFFENNRNVSMLFSVLCFLLLLISAVLRSQLVKYNKS